MRSVKGRVEHLGSRHVGSVLDLDPVQDLRVPDGFGGCDGRVHVVKRNLGQKRAGFVYGNP